MEFVREKVIKIHLYFTNKITNTWKYFDKRWFDVCVCAVFFFSWNFQLIKTVLSVFQRQCFICIEFIFVTLFKFFRVIFVYIFNSIQRFLKKIHIKYEHFSTFSEEKSEKTTLIIIVIQRSLILELLSMLDFIIF